VTSINSTTVVNGSDYPIYISPFADNYGISQYSFSDGWYYKKTSGSNYINWGVPVLDDVGSSKVCLGTNVNQIYFTFTPNSQVNNSVDMPYLYVILYNGTTLCWTIPSSTVLTAKTTYTYAVAFNGSSAFHESLVNSDGGTSVSGVMYPSYLSYSLTLSRLTESNNNLSLNNSDYLTSFVKFVGIKTFTASTGVDFTLNSISMELNGSTAYVLPGTNQFIFSESTVKDAYMYNAVNNLYSYFFMTNIKGTLSNTQILST
jgi:hypothetical protein